MPGNACSICKRGHEVRRLVDQAIAEGVPLRTIARQHGFKHHENVRRHRDQCDTLVLPEAVEEAVKKQVDVAAIDVGHFISGMVETFDAMQKMSVDPEKDDLVRVAASRVVTSTGVAVVNALAEERQRQDLRDRLDRLGALVDGGARLAQPDTDLSRNGTTVDADWSPTDGL